MAMPSHEFIEKKEQDLFPLHRAGTVQTEFDDQQDQGYNDNKDGYPLARPRTHTLGIIRLRPEEDSDPTDWWFASTAIPLIAATFAPMANMLSIAALVSYWREHVQNFDTPAMRYSTAKAYKDPPWCYNLNAASVACGFAGNLFLLFNFTKRVRYIVALPVTIIFFYFASGILIGIIVSMQRYKPPGPDDVYSAAFWHAVIAACLYMLNSMILMINMLGYFLGHYPQHFTLNDEQRNLILQTMLFFIWLGGGAGIFQYIEKAWNYSDALYFCDVTILTIGFGDFFATEDLGRGLVFPFSVGGTIILGLMVSSIHKFARELSKDNVVRKHVEKRRVDTLSRAVTMDQTEEKKLVLDSKRPLIISGPSASDVKHIQEDLDRAARERVVENRAINFVDPKKEDFMASNSSSTNDEPLPSQFISQRTMSGRGTFQKSLRSLTFPLTKTMSSAAHSMRRVTSKKSKQILMIEERDRFNTMRKIQTNASTFKRYYALSLSITAFGMLWCLGAMVFYFCEVDTQDLNYFEGLYLCYVSLLTIGYGDLSPRSNSGQAFFVVWSLIAVPTMTILVSDLGDTVIGGFKRGVLQNDLGLTSQSNPKHDGRVMKFLKKLASITKQDKKNQQRASKERTSSLEEARPSAERDNAVEDPIPKTLEELATESVTEAEMMRRLAFAIRHVAEDLKTHPGKQYSYEEWVEFTRLIRFSKFEAEGTDAIQQLEYDEAVEGVVEWDWLDEHSPMTSEQSESEWVLDRLCESLLRVFKKGDLLNNILSAHSKDSKTRDTKPITTPLPQPKENETAIDDDEGYSGMAGMSAVTKFFRGEADYGQSPQWSKRAKAKMAANESVIVSPIQASGSVGDRRRSSVSVTHRRHGPFAFHPRRASSAGLSVSDIDGNFSKKSMDIGS